ncbi:MAG: helix-turn-helix domain-containing protein [Filifactoraceae bacterium]
MNKDLGGKIKQARTQKKMTLKDLSEKTELSVEFLSQLERGLTSISIDKLDKIANALKVNPTYFFTITENNKTNIVRSYNKELYQICTSKCIQYNSSGNLKEKEIFTRLVEIIPNNIEEKIEVYNHAGEEFIYVLEGVLTLFLNNSYYELNVGDSIQYDSNSDHNWANYTNQIVKLLVVATPNPFN